jgi:hypothetical protein
MQTTTAITKAQLADLTGYSPSFFSNRRDDLPETFLVHDGGNHSGRPSRAFSLEDLAEFIIERTGLLSNVECRLRLALNAGACQPVRVTNMKKLGMFRLVEDANGKLVVVPYALERLSPEDRAEAEAAIAHESATVGAPPLCVRERRTTTSEGSQP